MDQTTLLLGRLLSVAAAGLFSFCLWDLAFSGDLVWYLNVEKFGPLIEVAALLLGIMTILKLRAMALATLDPNGDHAHHDHHHHDHDHHHDHSHPGDAHHDHGPECCHDHHDNNGHQHDVSLWRLIVLSVPLMIMLMGLAPKGLSWEAGEKRRSKEQNEDFEKLGGVALAEGRLGTGNKTWPTNLKEIQNAAAAASSRSFWENRVPRISGQYLGDVRFPDRFRLTHFKIVCCNADATPIDVTVLGKPDPTWRNGDWLELTGPVSFAPMTNQQTGRTRYLPVIHLQEAHRTAPKPFIQ